MKIKFLSEIDGNLIYRRIRDSSVSQSLTTFEMKNKMNKQAQIAETITWFAAFVIIFFIIMLFTFITVFFALKNPVDTKDLNNMESAVKDNQVLLSFLDSETSYNNQNIKIKDLIVEYYKSPSSEIQLKLNTALSAINKNIYSYEIIVSKEGSKDTIQIDNIFTSEANFLKLAQSKYTLAEEIKIRQANEFYLPSSTGKIKINYFIEERPQDIKDVNVQVS